MPINKLQDYTPDPDIPGVRIISPTIHKDTGGEFLELVRGSVPTNMSGNSTMELTSAGESLLHLNEFDGDQLQVNMSLIHPGTVKGFHIHRIQTDIWATPQKLLVNLIDLRGLDLDKEWAVEGRMTMRFVLDRQVLVIPPGVAHSITNCYNDDRLLIYLVNRWFNPKDEWRIPWDILGEDVHHIEKG